MTDITLTHLYTYPIKSCGSLSHKEIALDARGPLWDRRWMVTDGDGKVITQRELPAMALIQPRFENGNLALTAPNMPEICVPLGREAGEIWRVEVWDDICAAWDEGEEFADWFSDYLHVDARLVRMADGFVRAVDPDYAPPNTPVGFADGYPILIVSDASLDELNRRLIERDKPPVPISRFRPNIVVTGASAFAEDNWDAVQIGDVTLDVVKPCARCVLTSVDQLTGTVPDTAEPLATLNTFRKQNNKVMFAQNAIHRAPGTLRVGEQLKLL
ncbi:MAG: MOSC N-terminal beta barrel domain-containing protein [Chloroflexota bacterium]